MREFSAGSRTPMLGSIGLVLWLASLLIPIPAAADVDLVVVPPSPPYVDLCLTDLNHDGLVNAGDIGLFAPQGPCPGSTCGPSCPGDFDVDCDIDSDDIAIFISDLNAGFCSIHYRYWNVKVIGWPPPPPPPSPPGNRWWGYALAPLGPVVDVAKVTVLHPSTSIPVAGVDTAGPTNTSVSSGFNLAAGGGVSFVGFLASVSEEVPAGPVDLQFLVGAPEGTTFEDIRDAYLGTPGAAPVSFAAGETDSSGNPTGNHQSIEAAASVMLLAPTIPSMSVVGLGALATVLLGVGLGRVRQRRR